MRRCVISVFHEIKLLSLFPNKQKVGTEAVLQYPQQMHVHGVQVVALWLKNSTACGF